MIKLSSHCKKKFLPSKVKNVAKKAKGTNLMKKLIDRLGNITDEQQKHLFVLASGLALMGGMPSIAGLFLILSVCA
jgi:hypothetical protein